MAGIANGAGTAVTRAFAVSITMAVLMILMAFGFMSFVPEGKLPDTVTLAIIMVVFALSFVASAVLLDRAGTGQVQSIIAGAIVALGITVFALTIYTGAKYINDGMLTPGNGMSNETLLAGFALALIASAIIDRLILKF